MKYELIKMYTRVFSLYRFVTENAMIIIIIFYLFIIRETSQLLKKWCSVHNE